MAETKDIKLRIWPHYVVDVNGQQRRLSPQQGMVLSMMMAGQTRNRHLDSASELLWPDPDLMPDAWREHFHTVCSQVRRILIGMGMDRNALRAKRRK